MRGGPRPGSGPRKGTKYSKRGTRKPQIPKDGIPQDIKDAAKLENLTPLEFLEREMNNTGNLLDIRIRCAQIAAPFKHARKGEGAGKKDEKAEKAKEAGKGRFAPSKAPLELVK